MIAFIDEDALAEADWLARLMAGYSSPQVGGVGGSIEPMWLDGQPRWFPEDRSGAPKITASVPLTEAIAALDAMPLLEGLQWNCESKGVAAPAGNCQTCAPVEALIA